MVSKKSGKESIAPSKSAPTKPAAAEKVYDPFSPESLRLTEQDRASLGVTATVVELPCRRPKRQEWVRTHRDLVLETTLFKLEDADEYYLVVPDLRLHSDLFEMALPFRVQLAVNRAGSTFLWAARVPADGGSGASWHRSAMECQRIAEKQWIRVTSDKSAGAYVTHTTTAELPEPKWPNNDMRSLLELCFRARVIDNPDHKILKLLRGEE